MRTKGLVCRCCGSSDVRLVLDLGKQAWGNDYKKIILDDECEKYPLELFFCNNCVMTQIGYTVPKTEMFLDHTYLSGTTKSLKDHFVDIGSSIMKKIKFNHGDYILDIGGNDGTFLEFFKENEIKVLNIDSGVLQATISNSKGIFCINDFFNSKIAEDILSEHGQSMVIHGSGIFFHLEELHSVFEGIKLLLEPNGILVAEYIYLPSMIKNCAYDQIYHEHLIFFSLISLQNLLDQFDLEVFDAELKSIHGGSCISYISHKNHIPITKRCLDLTEKEYENGFHKINTYIRFKHKVEKNKQKLISIISELKRQGKSIQALGAPVKGSTIINYCKLTLNEIDCGVEINPYKCDTYFPGTKIPVYNEKDTLEPDVYLLLAWNFKDEILPKFNSFREKGGKILIPIPEPEFI